MKLSVILVLYFLGLCSATSFAQLEPESHEFRFQFGLSAMWSAENREYFKSGGSVYFSAVSGPINKKGAYYPELRSYVGLTKGTAWMGSDTQLGKDSNHFMLSMNHLHLPYTSLFFRVESGEGSFHPFFVAGLGAGRVKGEHWLDIQTPMGSDFLVCLVQTSNLYYELSLGFKTGKGLNHLDISYTVRDWGRIPVMDAKTVVQSNLETTYRIKSIPTTVSSLNFTYSRTFRN